MSPIPARSSAEVSGEQQEAPMIQPKIARRLLKLRATMIRYQRRGEFRVKTRRDHDWLPWLILGQCGPARASEARALELRRTKR